MKTRRETTGIMSWKRLLLYIVCVTALGYLNSLVAQTTTLDSVKPSKNAFVYKDVSNPFAFEQPKFMSHRRVHNHYYELINAIIRQREIMDQMKAPRPVKVIIEKPAIEPALRLEDWMLNPRIWRDQK
jgi:hypothetical protein